MRLAEEAVLCYFSSSCYLLSPPTINNALRGTMSNSPEDYGGLLEILWGDFFGGERASNGKLEIVYFLKKDKMLFNRL